MKFSNNRTEHTPGRRRLWFDSRFAVGLVLVIASTVGVVAVISATDSSIEVLAARSTLVPGAQVDSGDFVATSVRLDAASALYLAPGDIPEDGLVVTKTISRGELAPSSAVGAAAGVRQAAVVIGVSNQLAASIGPGTLVDIWAAGERSGSAETGEFAGPAVIVPGAVVVRVIEGDGIMMDAAAATVEVLVPRTRIARVLEALANGDALSLVPVSIPAGR
ncbi:MAG: hypothetical protein ACOH1J_07120 [Microbacteriaceae bacterium]